MCLNGVAGVSVRSKLARPQRTEALMRPWQPMSPRCGTAMACCLIKEAQQPPARGYMPSVAADDCMDSTNFLSCIPWLQLRRSTEGDHRSRAFQFTPSVALSVIQI